MRRTAFIYFKSECCSLSAFCSMLRCYRTVTDTVVVCCEPPALATTDTL
jgi:hypothetical protein